MQDFRVLALALSKLITTSSHGTNTNYVVDEKSTIYILQKLSTGNDRGWGAGMPQKRTKHI